MYPSCLPKSALKNKSRLIRTRLRRIFNNEKRKYCKFGNFHENFSRMALKDIFVTLKICYKGMIYLYPSTTKWSPHFTRVLFSRNFAYAKFRENKPSRKFPDLQFVYPSCLPKRALTNKSSLIRVFHVCYSVKRFVISSSDKEQFIWEQKKTRTFRLT